MRDLGAGPGSAPCSARASGALPTSSASATSRRWRCGSAPTWWPPRRPGPRRSTCAAAVRIALASVGVYDVEPRRLGARRPRSTPTVRPGTSPTGPAPTPVARPRWSGSNRERPGSGSVDPELVERLGAARVAIEDRIAAAGGAAGSVRIVAVSKTHPAETVAAALAAGFTDFGENYAAEFAAKAARAGGRPHMALHRAAPDEQGSRRGRRSSTCTNRSTGSRS